MANILNILDKETGKYVAIPSIQGESAYEIAVKHGFEGTEKEWADMLNAGESSKIYKCALEQESFDGYRFAKEVEVGFELPELPSYDGGTRFYCQPTPIVNGEKDFYNEFSVMAGKKEVGYETEDAYKTNAKLYVDSGYESFVDDVYAPVYNTTKGSLDDYLVRSIVRERDRISDPAMILFYTNANDGHWGLTSNEFAMYGGITGSYRVWLYPVEEFEPVVNGVHQPVDITIPVRDTDELDMCLITGEQYLQMIHSHEQTYGLCTSIDKISQEYAYKINTEGYTEDAYLIVRYSGNDTGESGNRYDLNPFIEFTVHSCAYDYTNYKVWTTNMDGSEASTKYTISLTTPLKRGEYFRFSPDPLYMKFSKVLYKKEEYIGFNGAERFTGEYDDDLNPIFTMTLHEDAPEKVVGVTQNVNRYLSDVPHGIVGLIKYHEITPTWHRTNDLKYITYTGNCFALDEKSSNFGVYQVRYPNEDSLTDLSWCFLQVYPAENSIAVDRGCNVWCYDCDIVLRYTRELTNDDYLKYHF